ncbi:MAG: hypothetical protein R3D58_12760 [Saprospiraceae bacterium]|nr:hypothetical protein [Lewinellaceae bacterium]
MTKGNLKQLLAEGNLSGLADRLADISSNVSNELQNDILLLIGRYRTFSQQRRIGALSRAEQDNGLAQLSASFMELIDALPEEVSGMKKNRRTAVLLGIIPILLIIALVYWMSGNNNTARIESEKIPESHNTGVVRDSAIFKKDTTPESEIPEPKSVVEKPVTSPVATQSPGGNSKTSKTIFNNTTVNGPQIINPSGPITINNDYSGKKDTANGN